MKISFDVSKRHMTKHDGKGMPKGVKRKDIVVVGFKYNAPVMGRAKDFLWDNDLLPDNGIAITRYAVVDFVELIP